MYENHLRKGCWRCRSRKVKCDEQKPQCRACQKLGKACDGYGLKLIWAESESQDHKSDGRRSVSCESTWAGLSVLDSDLVDHLILQYDPECVGEDSNQQRTRSHNPFSVFQTRHTSGLMSTAKSLLISRPSCITSQNSDDRMLFHHYTTHVAFLMIPLEHPRNPWNTCYPAVARAHSLPEEIALYNAMLSHAAYNLASLSSSPTKMLHVAVKHYNKAIEQLNTCIENTNRDYGGTVAAILTLLMAEVYSGRSNIWKHHLRGAWALLGQYATNTRWASSDFARYSTQSLCIIKIVNDTCEVANTPTKKCSVITEYSQRASCSVENEMEGSERGLLLGISSTKDFGFTIGSTASVLRCISNITTIGHKMSAQALSEDSVDDVIANTLSCLKACEATVESPNSSALSTYQLNSFITSTYIYLYRTIFDLPSAKVGHWVSLTLHDVIVFHAESEGNFSIWPAFIAAVEAYTAEDMASACRWLDRTTKFGMGNRLSVRKVVEEVWRKREVTSQETGIDKGLISVDWRDVTTDLGLEVLLI